MFVKHKQVVRYKSYYTLEKRRVLTGISKKFHVCLAWMDISYTLFQIIRLAFFVTNGQMISPHLMYSIKYEIYNKFWMTTNS